MKTLESNFSNQILKLTKNKLGDIFFFNHIAVIELNEGVHLDAGNSSLIINDLISYFGKNKPFGIVANRINSYSVNLLHMPFFREQLKNLSSYGVVGHDPASRMNAKIENSFCISDQIDFNNIYDAVNSVYNKVINSKILSIN